MYQSWRMGGFLLDQLLGDTFSSVQLHEYGRLIMVLDCFVNYFVNFLAKTINEYQKQKSRKP